MIFEHDPICTQKSPNSTKLIIVFIENWKEIGPWFWRIWITCFWFRPYLGSKLGSKLDQTLKLWISPLTVKIWVLQIALNGICTTVHLYIWGLPLTKISAQSVVAYWNYCPPKKQKWAKMGTEPKKCSGFFLRLKSKTSNTQKLKLDIQKV